MRCVANFVRMCKILVFTAWKTIIEEKQHRVQMLVGIKWWYLIENLFARLAKREKGLAIVIARAWPAYSYAMENTNIVEPIANIYMSKRHWESKICTFRHDMYLALRLHTRWNDEEDHKQ